MKIYVLNWFVYDRVDGERGRLFHTETIAATLSKRAALARARSLGVPGKNQFLFPEDESTSEEESGDLPVVLTVKLTGPSYIGYLHVREFEDTLTSSLELLAMQVE